MKAARYLLLVAWAGALIGCAAAPRQASRWVEQQGGLCRDAQQRDRLERACAALCDTRGLGDFNLMVIDSPRPGAFAWPQGRVCVTSGLMALADDDELAAAVAHEIGHLVEDGHVRLAALIGTETQGVERRADAIAVCLLRSAGVRTDAMTSLLRKLAAADAPNRAALLARAAALAD